MDYFLIFAYGLHCLPIMSFIQLKIQGAAFRIIGMIHFDQFFQLMFHFFHHIGGGVKEQDGDALAKVTIILMGDQFSDAYPSAIQHIHNPVEDWKVIVCADFQGVVLFHVFSYLVLGPGSWSLVIGNFDLTDEPVEINFNTLTL